MSTVECSSFLLIITYYVKSDDFNINFCFVVYIKIYYVFNRHVSILENFFLKFRSNKYSTRIGINIVNIYLM